MNMLIRTVSVHFKVELFSDHFILVRFQLLLFCIAEKILHLFYPFSGVHLGTRPLESNRQV